MLKYREAARASDSEAPATQPAATADAPGSDPNTISRSSSTSSVTSESASSPLTALDLDAQVRRTGSGQPSMLTLSTLNRNFSAVFRKPPNLSTRTARSDATAASGTPAETEEQRRERLKAEDLAAVELELQKYERDGLEPEGVNLLEFWQVCVTFILSWTFLTR